MAKTTKLVGYGISFDMELVGGVKTADDFNNVAKSVQKSINRSSNAVKSFEIAQDQLNQALRNGAISQKEYEEQLTRLRFRELKREEQLEKQRRAVSGLDKQESILAKNRQNRERMAGMAAAGVSGLGLGGRAAGAARFLGGAAGLGGPAAALGLGFGAVAMIKESISAFAELETKVASLKSLLGEPLGEKLTVQFRNLAKTTILTNNQLIENAKTWASYGLTTDGLTDRLRRLGTVAGGNSEKFRSLTIAFAQVNAQGKLMGQEKNQLINAGFSLQAVADAAGISMENFADAMKNGEIRAEHLNEALVKVTSEGGLFAGYLEKQAETLQGKMTILSSTWEEFLQTLGAAEKGPAAAFLDKLIYAAEISKDAAEWWGGEDSPMSSLGGAVPAEKRLSESTGFAGAGRSAFVDEPYAEDSRMYGGFYMYDKDILISQLQEKLRIDKETARKIYELRFKSIVESNAADKRRREAQEAVDKALAEAQKTRDKKRAEIEMQMYEEIRKNYSTTQQEFARVIANFDPEGPVFKKAMEEFASRTFTEGGEGFVGPMMGGRKDQEGRLERLAKEEQDRIDFEKAFAEASERDAKAKHKREMDLLALEEKAVAERLAREKRIAQGPADKDAMFTGGSVEEFMFLRRQTQQNEAAVATKAAEDRAQEQRDRIAEARKTLDERLATALEQIATQLSLNTNDSM